MQALDNDLLHGRQRGGDRGGLLQAIEALAAVGVAVDRQQEPRADLTEPIEDALHAEVRRTGGPDGADGRSAERRDDGFRSIRGNGGDAIAGDDARGAKRVCRAAHGVAQFIMRQRDVAARFRAADNRGAVAPAPQQVLREVERGVREEPAARHAIEVDGCAEPAVAGDAAKFQTSVQKLGTLSDGPLVKLPIVRRP